MPLKRNKSNYNISKNNKPSNISKNNKPSNISSFTNSLVSGFGIGMGVEFGKKLVGSIIGDTDKCSVELKNYHNCLERNNHELCYESKYILNNCKNN